MIQLFSSGGQCIGASASASIFPINIQGWFLLGLISLISLLSKGLPRVFSSTTVQKYPFFSAQSYLWCQFRCSVMSNSLPHESQHARPLCPSPTAGVHSNSRPSSQWCHPAISSSVIPFSSCPQSFPASGSFQMSQLFASGGQCIGASASASVLPMNILGWCPLGLTGLISLQSKVLSSIFFTSAMYLK